jgi:hypothetical protein
MMAVKTSAAATAFGQILPVPSAKQTTPITEVAQ